jgi:endogenous inhibitor of DNA gyrase (YacG/DUF329 family)
MALQLAKRGFHCPICKKEIQRSVESFPFCSERCRLIDLGKWAEGDYRIAGEPAPLPDESDEG